MMSRIYRTAHVSDGKEQQFIDCSLDVDGIAVLG